MKRSDFRFFHRLRVRWAEVDMQKIVFNAHYLMYFDTAITEYWRALALPMEEVFARLEGIVDPRERLHELFAARAADSPERARPAYLSNLTGIARAVRSSPRSTNWHRRSASTF